MEPNSEKPEQVEEPVGADATADFQAQLDEFKASMKADHDTRMRTLEAENALLAERYAEASYELSQKRENGDTSSDIEVELMYDPFDVQNGLAFKLEPILNRHNEPTGHYETVTVPADDNFPEGQVLGWKSERYRKDRGWRGWIPFRYGDEYTGDTGEKLTDYMVDPPIKGEGEAEGDFDMYVRRKGLILARMDKRISDARDRKRERKNAIQRGAAQSGQTHVIRDGVEIVGEGMKDQERPSGGWKMGEKPVLAPGHVRTELMPHNRPPKE